MGHPDFRVGGKIFATVGWPDHDWAMVKLTPDQQAMYVAAAPDIFVPVSGGWGRRGSTNVQLAAADRRAVEGAVAAAWRNVAPRSLVAGTRIGRERGKQDSASEE